MPDSILKKFIIEQSAFGAGFINATRSRSAVAVIYPDRFRLHFTFEVKADVSIPKNTLAFNLNALYADNLLVVNRPPSSSRQGWALPGFFELAAYGRIQSSNPNQVVFLLEGARPNGNDEVVDIPSGCAIKFDIDEFYSPEVSPSANPVIPTPPSGP